MNKSLYKEIKFLKKNTKGAFFILSFRISSFFLKNRLLKIMGLPIRISYKLIVQWVLGIDIPCSTKIGVCLNIFHGQGLIIHKNVIIGNYVTLRHNTTIGSSKEENDVPIIGNYVNIGANCVVIGKIVIGDHSTVGAGSVVIRDVPSYSVVVGNPARIIKSNNAC